MGSCKSQRSCRVFDKGTRSANMEDCLPREIMEAILGTLDRETLCTARLVSRTFCAVASANISNLTFRSPAQANSLERFPRLGHVSVHHIGDNESLAELDPRFRAAITHLTVSQGGAFQRLPFPELPQMPKLRELHVEADFHLDGAEVLQRLTSLEVLRIGDCTPSVALSITTMTWLTSLEIGLVTGPDEWSRLLMEPEEWIHSADFSWLQHATNLRKLEALHISVPRKALPLLGNLTGLTGLTWVGGYGDSEDRDSIAPLSRLSRLRSLHIFPQLSESDLAIACSLGLGSLAELLLRVSWRASADCGRLLVHQTALTMLGACGSLCNLQHMGAVRLELLQSLELLTLASLDAEGLDALVKATSLTKLLISTTRRDVPDVGLSHALAQLTHLRSLKLELEGIRLYMKVLNFRMALSPLTALTKLDITRGPLDNGDLRALLGLTSLQVLDLHGGRLTDDVVLELAVLTNLRTLRLCTCGVTSLAPATNILDPLRQARGWPPVDAFCA